jgi:Protein of unknown function (DUF2721)
VSVSAVAAIEAMVAPVAFVTVGGLLTNGLITTTGTMSSRLSALNSERLSILGGDHGELLSEDQLTPVDRERLAIISNLEPLVLGRLRWVRNACLSIYIAIGILVLSVIFLAAGIPAHSDALSFTALGLVVAGVLAEFAGIAIAVAVLTRATDALTYETGRAEALEPRK